MGATLVAQAITSWSHVGHQAFRALMRMAVTAKDRATPEVPAAMYFAGHDGLVGALWFRPHTSHDSKLRAVREAVAELEAAGAVVCTQPAISGSNAVYKLTLSAAALPFKVKRKKSKPFPKQAEHRPPTQTIFQAEDRPPTEAEVGPPTGAEHRPPTEAEHRPPPPYKEEETLEETLEELREDEGVDLAAQLAATRAKNSANNPPEDSQPSTCSNPDCLLGNIIDRHRPQGRRVVPCPECRGSNVIPFPGRKPA